MKYRVLCPFTSLLVLETEQDYARFGIERRALADILTVGPSGVALLHRSDFASPFEAGRRRPATRWQGRSPARCASTRQAERRARVSARKKRRRQKRARAATATRAEDSFDRGPGDGARRGPARPASGAPPRAEPPAPALEQPRQRRVRRRARTALRGSRSRRPRRRRCGPSGPARAVGRTRQRCASPPAPRSKPAPLAGPLKEITRSGPPRRSGRALWHARSRGARATRATCWRWSRSASAGSRSETGRRRRARYGSIIDLFPGPRRHAPVRGRAARARARRRGAGAGHRHLPQGGRAARRSSGQPPPARVRAAQGGPSARGVRGPRGRRRAQLPGRPVSRRRADPGRGSGPGCRRLDPRRSGAHRRHPGAPGRAPAARRRAAPRCASC